MAKKKEKGTFIKYKQGVTWIEDDGVQAIFKDRFWFLSVNPVLLPPNWRNSCDKDIIFRGNKIGRGLKKCGFVPLDDNISVLRGSLRGDVTLFIQRTFGFLCGLNPPVYYTVVIAKVRYLVTIITGEDGMKMCHVYRMPGSELVGNFYFMPDGTQVVSRVCVEGVNISFTLIVGYVCSTLVLENVARSINGVIEIK